MDKTLCVLGLGYIGLPTASTFATHGLKVIGVDTNPDIVAKLNEGEVHLFEPGELGRNISLNGQDGGV